MQWTRRMMLGGFCGTMLPVRLWAAEINGDSLVEEISRQVVFHGRANGPTWFHPRACVVPSAAGRMVLMTMQTIAGSDYFGPVHFTTTTDLGKTWSEPMPIEGFGRAELDNGYSVGVCDVVPEYHPQTNSVLAIGHNVYYKNGKLARPQRQRWPMMVVRSADGAWSAANRVLWDDPRGSEIYTCGCAQRVVLPDGDVLIPLSFAPRGREWRSVCTVRYAFDGQSLRAKATGNELKNEVRRGLLEPSLAEHDGAYYMTLRAEDDRGYVTVSEGGLQWQPPRAWMWEDGTPLTMSTTQQRWLPHSDGLYLVYTRRDEANRNVMRWRAPLYMARVDTKSLCLIRSSERIVLPLIGDGVSDAKHVARMGNFHTVAVTPQESWVTVGETLPDDDWKGDTLLARIRWNKPNREISR